MNKSILRQFYIITQLASGKDTFYFLLRLVTSGSSHGPMQMYKTTNVNVYIT